jgi:type III secretion system low calcium response chaperone LcrH/SycD
MEEEDTYQYMQRFFLPEAALERLKDPAIIQRFIDEDQCFQDVVGFEQEVMDEFYRVAHRIFQEGRYYEAADAFVFLTTLNPYVYEYWLGLGMAEQLTEDYPSSLTAYAMAIANDDSNPLPYYHSAHCYYQMDDKEKALASLELAIEQARRDEIYANILAEATASKEKILNR